MKSALERRLSKIEDSQRARDNDLTRLSESELEARIADVHAKLLQLATPEEIRTELRKDGCSDELLAFLPRETSEESHATH